MNSHKRILIIPTDNRTHKIDFNLSIHITYEPMIRTFLITYIKKVNNYIHCNESLRI